MSNTDYTRSQFIGFTMLYAAHIDIDFSDDEKAMIKTRISEDDFEKIYGDFNDMSDYEALQTILGYKEKFFADEGEKDILLTEIKTLFFADGKYSVMEKEFYHFIEKLM